MAQPKAPKSITTLRHTDATRKNIPTAEYRTVMDDAALQPVPLRYPRNTDLDPQLVWRGKDEQDWSDLVVQAPPLYIQEKVHPKALVDDLRRLTLARAPAPEPAAEQLGFDLFGDFNGVPDGADRTEFYAHDQNWSNRMILGDSLQVMASLAEREGLRGKVQCIYIDPPYGIKFNSNFQWSTTSRDVKDGNADHITREPEQVKAFRDTWRDGIHSYLTYLRDRLTVARDLLTESGSVFVQIGDENVHRVRAVMDEVFGEDNFVAVVPFVTTSGFASTALDNVYNFLCWYSKKHDHLKYRPLFEDRELREGGGWAHRQVILSDGSRVRLGVDGVRKLLEVDTTARPYTLGSLQSQGATSAGNFTVSVDGRDFRCPSNAHWKSHEIGMRRLGQARRIEASSNSVRYVRAFDDFPVLPLTNIWNDTNRPGYTDEKLYVVQTNVLIIQRCILMTTDPGDLVLDPTCGSGTTAYVAEQWGRRWITIDTSRVALALARARIMGARYPYYLLADSPAGQRKEAEVTRTAPSTQATYGSIRQGFVYERVPHITLKSIANNAEIDVIWEKWQAELEPLRARLNAALATSWEEWEIPREADGGWAADVAATHAAWWAARIARQREIDASIAAKAEFEYLYDRPYQDPKTVRVAGPFTVESLSPHRVVGVDEDGAPIDGVRDGEGAYAEARTFAQMILDNLRTAGVQQAHKDDRIAFTALTAWPGQLVCAEGRYLEGDVERRAAIFIGPEFGTVQKPDLVEAAQETAEAGFDVLIACAFSYDAQCTGVTNIGRVPILRARMNADLHMADDLKNTGQGNLFVVFGEPDITLLDEPDGRLRVKVNGVDVFRPQTGEVISDGPDGIACWFVDTDYNAESFFVRHAYFLGANDPYSALRTTLKAEIDADAWASLHSDTSRPFERPGSGRIAVKVINHLGDEVMKVIRT